MSFQRRLNKVLTASGLSISELAWWCGQTSEATMRTWLLGREPRLYTRVRIDKALGYLEREIERQRGSVMPLHIRQKDRRDHVEQLRGRYPAV